jgi:hypothetical protein
MKKHEWRERDSDGSKRSVRAVSHGGVWRVSVRGQDDGDWTALDPVPLPLLLELRDRLWQKYQRRRLPWEALQEIDRLIEDAKTSPQQ